MFNKIVCFFVLCLFFLIFFLWSQDSDIHPFGKKIRKIKFEGLVNVKESKANDLVRSFYGKKLDPVIPDAIQRRLELSGLFVEIQIYVDSIDKKTVTLLATVKENFIIKNIKIEGVTRININTDISLKKGDPFNIVELSETEEKIKEKYLSKGYSGVKVTVSHTTAESRSVDIVITVVEGMLEVVREIFFEKLDKLIIKVKGSNHRRGLLRVLNQKRRRFAKKGFFNEANISLDRDVIKRYYASYGFLDAKVIDVRMERKIDKKERIINLKIIYVLDEGDQWYYGGVSIIGNKVFDTDVLLAFFDKIRVGDPVNQIVIERAFIEGLQALYSNDGYLYNNYDMKQIRNIESKVVSFVIEIEEVERVYISDINITGNTKTKDNVIFRELEVKKGDVFSRENVIRSLRNLMATGYFTNVIPDVVPGSVPGLVGINFDIEEGRSVGVTFGITIGGSSGSFPVAGLLRISDTNFLGLGHNLQVQGTANQDQTDIGINFYDPRFLNTRWGMGGGVKYSLNRSIAPQDILFPVFKTEDIPDPHNGGYVYSSGKKAGQYFFDPGSKRTIPTSGEIVDLKLVSDYKHYSWDPAFVMDYYAQQIEGNINTGYIVPIFYRFLKLETGFQLGFDYISYDSTNYRPAYKEIRHGLKRWIFNDGMFWKLSWEARDNPRSPTQGFILSQRFLFTGGILGGSRTYLQSQTRFDYHYAFPKIKFQSKDDENRWTMDWHFKFHTAFVWLGAQFGLPIRDATASHSRLDGVFLGPGWSDFMDPDGRLLWESRIRLSWDIFRGIIFLDTFVDSIWLWPDEEAFQSQRLWKKHFYGAIGTGFRMGIPSFPIGIYLVKNFNINEQENFSSIDWNPTRSSVFPSVGLNIAIVFEVDIY